MWYNNQQMATTTVEMLLHNEASRGWAVDSAESFLAPLDASSPEARCVLERIIGRPWPSRSNRDDHQAILF